MLDKFHLAFSTRFTRLFCLYFAVVAPFFWLAMLVRENKHELTDGYRDAWAAFKAGKVTL